MDTTVSDDESFDDEDRDPNYMPETSSQDLDTSHASTSGEPPAKKRCPAPAFVEEDEEDVDSDLEEEDEEEGMEVEKEKDKGKGKGKGKGKSKKSTLQSRPTTWKKQDIDNPPLPEYVHRSPLYVEGPVFYFTKFFTPDLIQHITYHTNLYAAQKDISTSFTTDTTEILNFIAILLYMGVVECPSLDDYWAMDTRVPQVADLMSSKRFRTMRRTLHFNDNTQAHSSVDRFFKIRPLFTHLNKVYRSQPHTPKQSIDEVMVGYKGRTAGNLRQYVKNKPDKWGFKLFCRASEDGFIHDMVLYQGATTLQSHGVPLTPEQETLGATSQIVTVLTSTIPQSSPSAIFADNFFTSLEVVRYLKSQNCRYTGTARDDRVGKPGLTPAKDLGKSSVPRGTFEYLTTDDGILALRWKDNKVVTMLSNDLGVEPVSTCLRYSKDTKKKEEVICPKVIKSYNAHMGGIDKSDMLVHLYRTPMKSKRWYLRLFAYCLDISVCNGWLLYKRDCKALDVTPPLPLKDFRLQIYKGLRNCKNLLGNRLSRSNSLSSPAAGPFLLPQTPRGQRCQKPESDVRFDKTLFHVPIYNKTRQTCKLCSRQNHIVRSHIVCRVCKVHLCLNAERNCFITYHEAVA